jgi:Ca-activated chloride channel homolog
MQLRARNSRWTIIVLLAVSVLARVTPALSADDGLRIDIAPDAQVALTNQFGSITVEIWQENYVLLSAIFPDGRKSERSPIVIDNRTQQLTISVVRRPVDPVTVVDLVLKVPASVKLEVNTSAGAITLRGMAATAKLKSVSGDIRAVLPTSDLDVVSTAANGPSDSEFPAAVEGRNLHARFGAGTRTLKIESASGRINLAKLDSGETAVSENKPPSLNDSSAAAGTPASSKENEEISEGDVVRVDSQLVTLNVSVIDRNTSRGLVGLTQSDFKMFEDGTEQRIVQFEASSAPFDLVLLIDLSGSTRDVLKLIRGAALRFIDAARPADRIAVVTFAGKPTLVSALTLDRDVLRDRVNAIQTASGDTKLYDAIDFTMNEISKQRTKSRRTAIVLMSDGLDGSIPGVTGDGSRLPYAELLGRVREFDGVLYTLWLNTEYEAMNPLDTQPEAFDEGYDRMKELADSGGGIFYEVDRLENLAGAYERVVADLGTVYSLAYRPNNKTRDGKWRTVRVNVERPNAVARGKRGYYAN